MKWGWWSPRLQALLMGMVLGALVSIAVAYLCYLCEPEDVRTFLEYVTDAPAPPASDRRP